MSMEGALLHPEYSLGALRPPEPWLFEGLQPLKQWAAAQAALPTTLWTLPPAPKLPGTWRPEVINIQKLL